MFKDTFSGKRYRLNVQVISNECGEEDKKHCKDKGW